MTINKSQGQTFKTIVDFTNENFTYGMLYVVLSRVGSPNCQTIVDFTNENFTYGMLYVVLSRVGSPNCLTLLVREDRKTRNVIYNEIFT